MATEENMDSAVCKGENRAMEGYMVVVKGCMEVQEVGCKADMVAL